MKWFKHMVTMGESTSVNNMIDEFGIESYAHYCLFLELISEKFDGKNPKILINKKVFSRKVRIISSKKLETFVQLLGNFFDISVEKNENSFLFFYPKLLEIKDNHTKNLPVTFQKPESNLLLDKEEDKEEELKNIQKRKSLGRPADDECMKIFEIWNAMAKDLLPRCNNISAKRLAQAKARWKNKAWREGFECAMLKVYQSDFCCGLLASSNSTSGGAWRANIDWFLKPDSVFKILEGTYDNKNQAVKK